MENIKISKVRVSDLHNFMSSRSWGDWKFSSYNEEKMEMELTPTHNVASTTDTAHAKHMRREILKWTKKRGCIYAGPARHREKQQPGEREYRHSAKILCPDGKTVTAFTSDPYKKHWVTEEGENINTAHPSKYVVL